MRLDSHPASGTWNKTRTGLSTDGLINLQLNRKLENRLPQCTGEERKQITAEIERDVDEVRQALFEMEAEARAAPGSYRTSMNSRIRAHNDKLAKLSQRLRVSNTNSDLAAASPNPFSDRGAYSQNRAVDDAVRRTVQQGAEILERTSQSIYRSTQVAIETEEIGAGVIQELGTQREVLTRTHQRLGDTDAELSRSRRILRSMARVALTNKLVLVLIILCELAVLVGLIYYKFF